MLGVVNQQCPLPFEAEVEHHFDEIGGHISISQAIRQAALEVPGVVDPPLLLAFGGQDPRLVHDDQIAMRRKVGDEIRVIHDAVDRMEELGIELAGRGVVDLGPFHGAVVHQAQVGVNGEVRERVGGGGQPIEELLQVGLGNVSDARAGPNDAASGQPASFRWCGGRRVSRYLMSFTQSGSLDCIRSHSVAKLSIEDVRGAGILQEAIQREVVRSGHGSSPATR